MKNRLNIKQLITIHNIAEENRQRVQNTLNKCYKYTHRQYQDEMIYYQNADTEQEKYWDDSQVIYNNTVINGLKKYAGQAQEALFPEDSNWGLLAETALLKEYLEKTGNEHQMKEFLEKATNMFFDYINDENSNFNTEILNMMKDLAISTGVLYFEQGTIMNPFKCKHIPIWMIEFTTDRWDKPKDVFWIDYLYPQELLLLIEKDTLSENQDNEDEQLISFTTSDLDRLDENKKIKIVHAYIKSEDDTYTRYIVASINGEKQILRITDFSICPFIIGRMNVNSGDVYGSGVIMDNLDTIELLNTVSKKDRMLASSEVFDIVLARNDKIDLKSKKTNKNGQVVYNIKEDVSEKLPLSEIMQDANVNGKNAVVDNILKTKELEEKLERELIYQSLGGLENIGKPTATESEIREKEFQQYRAGEYARIKTEVTSKIFEIGMNILFNLGLFKNLADDLLGIDYDKFLEKKNIMIKMKYKSPLSKLNDKEELNNTVMMLDVIRERVDPAVYATYVDQLKFSKYVFDKSNISTEIKRSDQEIAELNPQNDEEETS